MKNYFIQLLNYDRYANETIFAAMLKTDPPEKSIQLMAHLLTAQQIWLNRCKGLPPIAGVLWPEGKTDDFAGTIASNTEGWSNYLDTLQSDDFEKLISYKNSQGDSFQNKLSDVLAHLINHGTHHRAQIGQQLKFAGIDSLPNTDYIFYIRQLNG
ncbi:MAG: DinB family protein [Bacteroidota bacterium]|nr:DinB family protein [Bacteroidota bacterium]